MRDDTIKRIKFGDVDINDPFFDSLKESYKEFSSWFRRKADECAYVMYDEDGGVQGFLYVKIESGKITDIDPPLNTRKCLKVGTFKVDSHGTRVGERFVKKIFDIALVSNLHCCYVTVFKQHERLIEVLKRYGFVKYGKKVTVNGEEGVYVKDFSRMTGDIVLDYPVVDARKNNKWLLAVRPVWHTRLFPDSILRTESSSIVEDLSCTNSIHKVYIAWMRDLHLLNPGDVIVVYRMKEDGRPAEYSAVATSLCVLQEIKRGSSFSGVEEYVEYCRRYSVFTEEELRNLYRDKKSQMYVLKMMYCVAFPKRPTRHSLIEDAGLSRGDYFGLIKLGDAAFDKILELGRCYEGLVVN